MLGFGTGDLTLFQISKELLDNASDAVARDLQQGVVARIEFTLDLSKAGQCDLVCCDTGLGTASIEKLFKCFNLSINWK